MNNLSQQLTDDMKTAMREQDKATLGTIRLLKSSIKNAAIEKGGADAVLTDAEISNVIRKEVKKRQDSIEQYEKAGRAELAETEKIEIGILQRYLPTQLSEEEILKAVDAAIAEVGATSKKEMSLVMKLLQETTGGRADGKALSKAVMSRLG